jgi:hypothetical protein
MRAGSPRSDGRPCSSPSCLPGSWLRAFANRVALPDTTNLDTSLSTNRGTGPAGTDADRASASNQAPIPFGPRSTSRAKAAVSSRRNGKGCPARDLALSH